MCYVIKILELNMSPGSPQVKNDTSKDVFLTFESSQNVNDLKIYINTYTKILRKKVFSFLDKILIKFYQSCFITFFTCTPYFLAKFKLTKLNPEILSGNLFIAKIDLHKTRQSCSHKNKSLQKFIAISYHTDRKC